MSESEKRGTRGTAVLPTSMVFLKSEIVIAFGLLSLLGGDFNEIIASHEKEGGRPHTFGQMQSFRDLVSDCSLSNIAPHGPKFTSRGIRNHDEIRVRLDRFLASSSWMDLFPISKVVNLNPSKSDHFPILIEVRTPLPKKKRRRRRFRFKECWIQEEECKKLIEEVWG